MAILIWSFATFLFGIVIGGRWRPSLSHSIEIAVAGGIFVVLHELVCGFFWCSFSAWWIRRQAGAFDRKP
jgi:hypothetical protein